MEHRWGSTAKEQKTVIAKKIQLSQINPKLVHDAELKRERLRIIPASANSSFKPGTCVRIEGFVEKPKYNGMLGQVKKLIEGNTYRVMVSSEKTEFGIEAKFLVGINHCVSNGRITGGILVWPDVARSNYPAVQHFDDDGFREKFVNPFSHIQDRIVSKDLGDDTVAARVRFHFYNDPDNKRKMDQSFLPVYEILKKRLGWTKPLFTAQITEHSCDIAFYDDASEGRPNRWFEAKYANFPVSKIKGAFVFIQNLHKPVVTQSSLNYEKWYFGILASGESKDMYNTCVIDPVTVFGEFSTRMENLCGVTCDTCKGYMKFRNVKFGTTDPNKPKSRRDIVEENKRKKKNLMRRTKDELKQAAQGQTITEPKPFKKK